jgi:hypothetical protein
MFPKHFDYSFDEFSLLLANHKEICDFLKETKINSCIEPVLGNAT